MVTGWVNITIAPNITSHVGLRLQLISTYCEGQLGRTNGVLPKKLLVLFCFSCHALAFIYFKVCFKRFIIFAALDERSGIQPYILDNSHSSRVSFVDNSRVSLAVDNSIISQLDNSVVAVINETIVQPPSLGIEDTRLEILELPLLLDVTPLLDDIEEPVSCLPKSVPEDNADDEIFNETAYSVAADPDTSIQMVGIYILDNNITEYNR